VGSYRVSLEDFTGPLDLLLHLVRSAQMDIFDLDIARLTGDYLAFIEREGVHDLAGAYHFLAMAASLIELKSRLLLPQPPREDPSEEDGDAPEDPREILSRQLAAYQSIQDVTQELAARYDQVGRHWPRQMVEQLEAEIVYTMDSLSVYDLMTVFHEVLERPRFKQITIFKDDYDIDEAMGWLRARFAAGPVGLRAVLLEQHDVFVLITTFIALLELIKREELAFNRNEQGEILLATASTADIL
jgi:segregation and condensation protein A